MIRGDELVDNDDMLLIPPPPPPLPSIVMPSTVPVSYIQNTVPAALGLSPKIHNSIIKLPPRVNSVRHALESSEPLPEPLPEPPPTTKKGRRYFTIEEDRMILKCIKMFGAPGRWSEIARRLPGRTGKQCRARYINYLDARVKCGSWSNEEDSLLMNLWNKHGMKWSHISQMIPGRTASSTKNRFNSLQRQVKGKHRVLINGQFAPMDGMLDENVEVPTAYQQQMPMVHYVMQQQPQLIGSCIPVQGGAMYSAYTPSCIQRIAKKRQRVLSTPSYSIGNGGKHPATTLSSHRQVLLKTNQIATNQRVPSPTIVSVLDDDDPGVDDSDEDETGTEVVISEKKTEGDSDDTGGDNNNDASLLREVKREGCNLKKRKKMGI